MRVLILTAAFGTGHNQVAEALREAAVGAGQSADVVDALAVSLPKMNRWLTGGFIQLLARAPGLYRLAYNGAENPGSWSDGLKESSMQALARIMWQGMSGVLAQTQPDVILCTHPFPLGVLAAWRRQRRISVPVVAVLTDFAAHSFWVHGGVDQYHVATAETAASLAAEGVPEEMIHVSGIPVRHGFGAAPDRAPAMAELGLDPARPTVLVMGGGLGLGPLPGVMQSLLAAPYPLQTVLVAGHNQRLLARLEPLVQAANGHASARLLGYVSQIDRLMAAADLIVTKPGAVTASEALALGVPMLLVDPIPGHEERNQEALVAAGAARSLALPEQAGAAVAGILADGVALSRMARAARLMGRPHAARQVIEQVARLERPLRTVSA